jgi:hypothetical protein
MPGDCALNQHPPDDAVILRALTRIYLRAASSLCVPPGGPTVTSRKPQLVAQFSHESFVLGDGCLWIPV